MPARTRRTSAIAFVASYLLFMGFLCGVAAYAQQPAEPVDITPINGETYYLINQLTGLQADLNANSTANGASILDQTRSFTSLSQRWAVTKTATGNWKISNIANGLCLDAATSAGSTSTVQNTCSNATTQVWTLQPTISGYYSIGNVGTGLTLDLTSNTAAAALNQTALSSPVSQSQQWLLRPVFFRGVDNAMLEKQEANKVANGVPWWNDAGTKQDVLQILKNHGVNMIRIRPTTVPPYATYTSTTCTGNGCYAETDPVSIDLAKRAKALGMSVELSLFFDGGSSVAVPGAWSAYSLTQAESALYTYVKAEVEAFRAAGAMPDMVAIGNEVDTGFLSALGTSPKSSYSNYAAMQKQGMQAIADASSDTSIGAALPMPIRCMHVTPAYDLSSFFTAANNYSIPFDAMCQSYYPIYHGPLTAAQAAASNPGNKPIEQTTLTNAATSIGKPIFLIEIGEHYESGYGSNDPWYPTTPASQRQFILDVNGVLKGLPNNLAMGFDYWDATGVNIFKNGGGYSNGDGLIDSLYIWNGLTLFDNADTAGYANASLANFSATLPGLDALGGKLDANLTYKLVNQATGQILESTLASTAAGAALDTTTDIGIVSQHQQWTITSKGDGYFNIANVNSAKVLDNGGNSGASAAVVQNGATTSTSSQEWNVVTAGGGYFALVNKLSGLVLDATNATTIAQTAPASTTIDWVTAAATTQLWQIVPVHISATSAPAELLLGANTPSTVTLGGSPGVLTVTVANSAGVTIGSPQQSVVLSISGPNSFTNSTNATSSNGVATVDLSGVKFSQPGSYVLTASAAGLTSATATITVAPVTSASTTLLTASPSTTTQGQSVTLTATVSSTSSGTPTGSVVFFAGSTQLGAASLNGAAASLSTTSLPVGVSSLTAVYQGDTSFATSTSPAVSVTVNPQNIWVLNTGGAFSELANTGTAISSASGYVGGGVGVAIDNAGYVWSATAANTLSRLSNTGVASGSYSGGGLNGAAALAIDGAGQVWIANANNSLSVFTNAGAAVSPASGYTGVGLSTPSALAVDGSGNVWVANAANSTVTVLLGAADPVVTPLATAVQNRQLGVKP